MFSQALRVSVKMLLRTIVSSHLTEIKHSLSVSYCLLREGNGACP